MKSPFPGMDPYLESHWGDVHSLITYARDALGASLPADLRARVEERVLVEAPGIARRGIYPDLRVVEPPGVAEEAAAPLDLGGLAAADPLVGALDDELATEGFLQIVDVASGGRVVTVLEVLSRSNKLPGTGQDLYRKKQRELLAGAVSLVEIDLLRAGERVLVIPAHSVPPSHRTAYQVCVSRAARPGFVELYRAPLRERLPVIRVPLRATDADVPLDLQALVERCYREGRYDDVDYRVAPEPPLEAEDAAWADALLRGAEKR